jgi:hypothetical protein
MIGVIFSYGTETVEVRIEGSSVFFRTSQSHQFSDIGGIKLSKTGVEKEFPDLKDNKDWQEIARNRFKDKMKKMNSEDERADYLVNDLIKYGYKPKYMQKSGFRPVKL